MWCPTTADSLRSRQPLFFHLIHEDNWKDHFQVNEAVDMRGLIQVAALLSSTLSSAFVLPESIGNHDTHPFSLPDHASPASLDFAIDGQHGNRYESVRSAEKRLTQSPIY